MENLIVIVILLLIAGGGAFYLWRAKKRGAGCVGCPHAKHCGGACNHSIKDTNGADRS